MLKLAKLAAASSFRPAPPCGNGSAKKKEKKRKKKDASFKPDGGSPQPAAHLDYKEIGREDWRVTLRREQVSFVSPEGLNIWRLCYRLLLEGG